MHKNEIEKLLSRDQKRHQRAKRKRRWMRALKSARVQPPNSKGLYQPLARRAKSQYRRLAAKLAWLNSMEIASSTEVARGIAVSGRRVSTESSYKAQRYARLLSLEG